MATIYNYYGSIEYYNDNLAIYPKCLATWNTYTDNQKMAILTRLSKQVDRNNKWIGIKTNSSQFLEFPRNYKDVWVDEYLYDPYYKNHNKIPDGMFDIVIELLNDNLVGDNNRFSKLWVEGVRSINDNLISVSLDKPVDIKDIYNYIEKYMFDFTLMGYTQYRKAYNYYGIRRSY